MATSGATGTYRCRGPGMGSERESDRNGQGTDLVGNDKGTDKDEGYGCEEYDCSEESHGFEHLYRKALD